jgi:citronellol/citronellal dehydrogenase
LRHRILQEITMTAAYRSVFRDGLMAGKTILITGAGSGIGRCTAHELASLGASLALVGRKLDKLEAVATELGEVFNGLGLGQKVTVHSCDIREEEAVKTTVANILQSHGRIDGLVNNAGGQYPAPLASISAKGWDAVVRNNLTGGFLMAREVYNQYMGRHAAGDNLSIVNMIADMWMGMPGMGHSGAARAGMLNFTETAALEWAPVRVNAVAPGWIASSGMDTYPEPARTMIKNLYKNCPLQRMGTESEVASAITFLLSPGASFVSGTCIRIDGAAPNAKRVWPSAGNGSSNAAFDALHLTGASELLKNGG